MSIETRKPNYNFSKDINIGHEGEDIALQAIHEIQGNSLAYRVTGYEPRFDIIIPSQDGKKEITIEVKNDKESLRTGNIAIETARKKYNSEEINSTGISISEANFYVYVIGEEAFIAKTSLLKKYAEENTIKLVWGGDGLRTQMRLIKLEPLKKQKFFKKMR